MASSTTLLALLCCVSLAICADQTSQTKAKKPRSSSSEDLKTESSYGLGYGLSYPYYGWGGLGTSGYYGGKGFILPVFNYGIGGLGYGGYGYGGHPYGYSQLGYGGHYGYPYGGSYYSQPFGSSYYGGHHGLGGYHGYGGYGGYGGWGGYGKHY